MINRYSEISEILAREIDSRVLAKREKIPTEKSLSERFGVSRETVRKALKHLIESGRIYSIQGSGYYVKSSGLHMISTINQYTSITELIRNANGQEGDLEVQISKRRPNEAEMQMLDLEATGWVFVLERIRAAGNEPVVYSQNILPQSIFGTGFPDRFEPGSLSSCLEQKYGIYITEALMEIQAVRDEDALPYRLKQFNPPLLKFLQVHYDAHATPIFLSCDYMRNDLIRFFVNRYRTKGGSHR